MDVVTVKSLKHSTHQVAGHFGIRCIESHDLIKLFSLSGCSRLASMPDHHHHWPSFCCHSLPLRLFYCYKVTPTELSILYVTFNIAGKL